MERLDFSAARAVFFPGAEADCRENAVTLYGFHHAFECAQARGAAVSIAARSFYRLYVNGRMVMHGPARTAHGYARVDVIDVSAALTESENHIAVEVVAYGDFYKKYSNDCTLEPGLLTVQVEADGKVLSATGRDGWRVCRLTERAGRAERIAHSREAGEICRIVPGRTDWRVGKGEDFVPAQLLDAEPVYLVRRSPLPTLAERRARNLLGFGACRIDPEGFAAPEFWNRDDYNPEGYVGALEEHPVADCRRTVEDDDVCAALGAVTAKRGPSGEIRLSGAPDKYALFDMGENGAGFIGVEFSAERAGVVDVVHCEAPDTDGAFSYPNNVVTRLHVPAGRTDFLSMEPSVARYVRLYFRGTGDVTVHGVTMREYTFPDDERSAFLCSDEEINRLYRAAKKTLVLNTLDIFMDCPDRERGGWLCDSLWTARAAFMMLSDARVEKDFLENFLLTPAEGMSNAFFPDVYPGCKSDFTVSTGISTWSFWLMCELCEYVRRTGDTDFAREHEARVEAFVRGSGSFIGSSGLIEGLDGVFIDWSLSNRREYQDDVSTPVNALYSFMLRQLGALYGRKEWTRRGEEMRRILREAIARTEPGGLKYVSVFPDHWLRAEDGALRPGGSISESGMATALWSGLFEPGEIPALVRRVRDTMGPAPRYPSDPNIGKSGLFIGLCIRLDMLARLGMHGQMFEDMKAIYLPQLAEGPGTLWEHSVIDSSSRCHGFNGHAGVHLMRDVLGMGAPEREEDGCVRLTVAPHPCGLRWARGSMELPEGLLAVSWKHDGEQFVLDVHLPPESREKFRVDVRLPREARALEEENVCVRIH
ncbi:MAG: hypothetical protein IJO98_05425 [Clostridia bacterium]|nr:hypothetical protein [Clostridia bacterium]